MFRFTTVLAAFALAAALPLHAADEKKDEKKTEKKADPKPASPSEYTSVGEINGVLARGPGKSGDSIALRGTKLTSQGNYRRPNVKVVEDDTVIELTPDVKVRFMHAPPKTDEKGRTIPYTEKELKELKGDPTMKGYKAELDDLKAGKAVTIHLVKLKGAKGEMAEKRFADRIYITGDGPPLPPGVEKPAERKKDK